MKIVLRIYRKFENAVKFSFFLLLFFSMCFARSFVGIYVLGFRFGEFIILASLLASLFVLFSKKNNLVTYLNDAQYISYKLILISFLPIALISNSNLLSTYAYRTSSYIWSISFLFIGSLLLDKKFFESSYSKFLLLTPFIVYVISTGNYPNFIIDFFKENSDKFQFIKASDAFLVYLSINFLNRFISRNEKNRLLYFTISSGLYLPFLLTQSRGSAVGAFMYICFEIYNSRKFIFKQKKPSFVFLLLFSLLFVMSSYRVNGVDFSTRETEPIISVGAVSSNVTEVLEKKETIQAFLSFYIEDGRITSTDETTDWRLDIWQDVIEDLNIKNQLLVGYGYKEIIPVMTDPSAPGRLGRDGLNENVHNYFVNILARGGLIQLFIFILFHGSLIYYWYQKNNNFKILGYILPSFFVSSLDVTMEGVQYPMIYYSFLAHFIFHRDDIKLLE
jgi:hypothetical protein